MIGFFNSFIKIIIVVGYHMDSKYFPNPKRFDPKRFSDENRKAIVQVSYMPFSIGPRNCVVSSPQIFMIFLLKISIF